MGASKRALAAPFPIHGGKYEWRHIVWDRLGQDLDGYLEPFAGSIAMLLTAPRPARREVICERDLYICNFWRAMQADAAAVARYADRPTFHADFRAAGKWMLDWAAQVKAERKDLRFDWYDVKAAGLWAWGQSLSIGLDFPVERKGGKESGKIPHVYDNPRGSRGTAAQRRMVDRSGASLASDETPFAGQPNASSGRGVMAQRTGYPSDEIPHVKDIPGGQGVMPQAADGIPTIGQTPTPQTGLQKAQAAEGAPALNAEPCARAGIQKAQMGGSIGTGERLLPWFLAIQRRIEKVVILDRDWTAIKSDSKTMRTKTHGRFVTGAFIDPPYRAAKQASEKYGLTDAESDDVAEAAYAWATDPKQADDDRMRIAFCMHQGDFPVPAGWTVETKKMMRNRGRSVDCIIFSPHCLQPGNMELF